MEITSDNYIFEGEITKTGKLLYNGEYLNYQMDISIQHPEIYFKGWIDTSESEYPMDRQEILDLTCQLEENFKLNYKLTDKL